MEFSWVSSLNSQFIFININFVLVIFLIKHIQLVFDQFIWLVICSMFVLVSMNNLVS